MLDPRFFKDNLGELETALKKRQVGIELISSVTELSRRRAELIQQTEALKAQKNSTSQVIAQLKALEKSNPAASSTEAEKQVASMKVLGEQIKNLDHQLASVEVQLGDLALRIPNIPHSSVPVGPGSDSNVEVRKWGTPPDLDFTPKEHSELGEHLGILDFERAGKMSGARFALYFGAGARLERALIQFMLDLHTSEHGYQEVISPFLVNRSALIGTGNLPKFEEDLFKTQMGERELFLIPTAEVPLTNIHREEILSAHQLPLYYTAYSPCFRSEAGSYGKDTRGLIRQHQFQKVELVKIVAPEHSVQEHESMTQAAERILQLLELPYRVIVLCTGDMGFSATKTYDIEVWLPGQASYREISSCSNCGDFQARRAQIRYRPAPQAKPQWVHTLNGSGLAVGRTWIAVLENGQNREGHVQIPKVLHRYLEGAPGFVRDGDQLWIRPHIEN